MPCLREPRLLHQALHAALSGVPLQGLRNVEVRVGVAMEDPPDRPHQRPKEPAIERGGHRVLRFTEVEDDRAAAGSEHAFDLGQRGFGVRDVAQPVRDGHRVEGGVGERKPQRVRLNVAGRARPFDCSPPRDGEHRKREVDAGDGGGPGFLRPKAEVAASAAEIEHARTPGGPLERQPHRLTLPPPMHAEAHHVVDEVVAPGEPREHRADPRRARFVVGDVLVRHGPNIDASVRCDCRCRPPSAIGNRPSAIGSPESAICCTVFGSMAERLPKPLSEHEARQVAEEARETEWTAPSFLKQIFLGELRLDLVHPFPEPPPERPEFRAFRQRLARFLEEEVDSDAIDRNGKIPPRVIQGLADLGAFGMKIPKEYGGLGFTQREYGEAMKIITSRDGNLVTLLSAHQSIGVPQPLKLFGTKEQKKKYLPRLARGEISAFALTESHVGSDPANLSTSAIRTPEGDYVLNGEKL